MLVLLTGVQRDLTVVWICISLMISDVAHLFRCLLVICAFSLEKCINIVLCEVRERQILYDLTYTRTLENKLSE